MKLAIAYYRVSTVQQQKSGLGLEAQQLVIQNYTHNQFNTIDSFIEIGSGRKKQLILENALEACRARNASLIVSSVDRLTRNPQVIFDLLEQKIPFIIADNPQASLTEIINLVKIAEKEAELISDRTKKALAIAKSRGTKLGNPKPKLAAAARIRIADEFSIRIYPIIKILQANGFQSLRSIARELEKRNILTARGKTNWTATGVKNLIERSKSDFK